MSLNSGLFFQLVTVAIAVYCVVAPPGTYERAVIPVTVKQDGNVLISNRWGGRFTGKTVGPRNVNNDDQMEVDLLTSEPSSLSLSPWLVFELFVSDGKTGHESKNLELKFTFSKDQYKQWKADEFKGTFDVEIKKDGKKEEATLSFGVKGETIEGKK